MAIKNIAAEAPTFQVFFGNPERSTQLLIAALKPTNPGHYQTGHHPKTVWILRALRSLTGLDFRATTRESLSPDEAHWLDLDANHRIKFFGTRMSRDSVWVAPSDAQNSIIKQWHDWFKEHGYEFKGYRHRQYSQPDRWYF